MGDAACVSRSSPISRPGFKAIGCRAVANEDGDDVDRDAGGSEQLTSESLFTSEME
jgi:hypothetical protein